MIITVLKCWPNGFQELVEEEAPENWLPPGEEPEEPKE